MSDREFEVKVSMRDDGTQVSEIVFIDKKPSPKKDSKLTLNPSKE